MEKIVLCSKCNGAGYIVECKQITLYESESIHCQCDNCNGSGRLIKKISYVPYVVKNNYNQE